ncbi:MAG: pyridoxal 5'-phosphate synthase glutaminase subunit PdxT [Candidatus Rifleibacteriota bacterium]
MNEERIKVGVLGLQGAVREHLKSLTECGVEGTNVKNADQLKLVDGLIIPGGESTTIRRLLDTSNLVEPVIEFAKAGKPVFGTCAGLILLAKKLVSGQTHNLGLMNITVERNSFGRQVDSFEAELNIKGIAENFNAVFIRAPHIEKVENQVEILAKLEDRIVMVKEKNLLGCSFHPELTDDNRITQYFINMVKSYKQN